MSIFKGLGVAMITPFKNGYVDQHAFDDLVDEMIERGANAIIIGGSTGEPHNLTPNEKVELVRSAIKVAKSRVPVIAGVNQASTNRAFEEAQSFLDAGADALLAITPYLGKSTPKGILIHYEKLKTLGLPIIAYNVPSRTGYDLPPNILKTLIDNNIVEGVKQASATMRSTMEYMNVLKDKGSLYSGEDDLNFSMRALGAAGTISVAGLVIPEAVNALFSLPMEKAAALQLELNGFINALFSEINPVPVKYMMSYLGKCQNELRLPLTPLDKDNQDRLLAQAKRIGLIS